MKCLIILFLLFGTIALRAQFGVGAGFDHWNAESWENLESPYDLNLRNQNLDLSAHYWFRLKNRRIEFMPEIAYRHVIGGSDPSTVQVAMNSLDFRFNTQFYVFDLAEDCDCPTFSKEGGIVKKGFFVEISPLVSLQQLDLQDQSNEFELSGSQFTYGFGAGAGVSIGLSDLITIMPFVKNNWLFGSEWKELGEYLGTEDAPVETSTKMSALAIGIRLSFRPDYKKKYRFRR